MKKTFEINARFERGIEDEHLSAKMITRITWEVDVDDMCEAISKARAYIRQVERDECAGCVWMTVDEIRNVVEEIRNA